MNVHFKELLFRCFQTNFREMRKSIWQTEIKLSQPIVISVEYLFSTFFLKTVKELKIPSISDYTHIESSDSLKAALD